MHHPKERCAKREKEEAKKKKNYRKKLGNEAILKSSRGLALEQSKLQEPSSQAHELRMPTALVCGMPGHGAHQSRGSWASRGRSNDGASELWRGTQVRVWDR